MNCDIILHAGDIGSVELADKLALIKPLKAVYGNIDGGKLRVIFKEYEIFNIENVKILMIHIGGYPGRYSKQAQKLIDTYSPDLFISGHSHILKVMSDNKYGLLHINPGSAGKSGFHKHITFMRFEISNREIRNLEIYEAERNR
jgi:putative phosphoesterase